MREGCRCLTWRKSLEVAGARRSLVTRVVKEPARQETSLIRLMPPASLYACGAGGCERVFRPSNALGGTLCHYFRKARICA